MQSSRPVVTTVARPDLPAARGAFDLAGVIDGLQAALLVSGLTLLASRFAGEGLADMRTSLGGNFTIALVVAGAFLAFAGTRTGLLARRADAYGLFAASGGLFIVGASLAILAITPDDPQALPGIVNAAGPWAIAVAAAGFGVYGARRAQEEIWGHGDGRTPYGIFLLVLSLGGFLAAYRVARVALGMM